jgi:hypothetical protein
MHVKRLDSSLSAPALDKIKENGISRRPVQLDASTSGLHLPDCMQEEAFQNVTMEPFGDNLELICAFNELHMLTMEEFAAKLEKVGKEVVSTFHKLIGEAYQESITGAALCIPRIVCIRQKPV